VKHARHKFALLLRLAFLEGANRANTIFAHILPARVWVFSERITFYPKNAEMKGTGTTAYAWFVWVKDAPNSTELKCSSVVVRRAIPKQSSVLQAQAKSAKTCHRNGCVRDRHFVRPALLRDAARDADYTLQYERQISLVSM
jgi:hypothetical protein